MAEVVIDVVGKSSGGLDVLGNLGSVITGIESAFNLASQAAHAFAGLAMEGLDAIAGYERLEASLTTLVASQMLQNGAATDMAAALKVASVEAEGLVKWNEQLAINSPFTSEGVAQAFRMAMAYGFTTDEAKRLTEALIDFAAGSGASEYAMQQIARALGQISATGKVTGGDMLQLVNAGLPVVDILAKGFNVTTAELMDMRSKGLLPATEAIEYITTYLETNFAGAAERQATSWAGLKGTFEDIKQIGLREFFGGLFDALQPVAVSLSNFLQSEGMDKLKEWGTILGEVTKGLIGLFTEGKLYDLGAALQNLGGGAASSGTTLYALGTAVRVFQQALDDGLPIMEAFKIGLDKFFSLAPTLNTDILGTMDSFISNVFGALTNKIVAFNAGDGPVKLSDRIIEFLNNLGKGEGVQTKMDDAAGRLVEALITTINNVKWAEIATAFDELVAKSIGDIDWESLGDGLTDNISALFTGAAKKASDGSGGEVPWWHYLLPAVGSFEAFLNTETGQAIWTAIKDFFKGVFEDVGSSIMGWLTGPAFDWAEAVGTWGEKVNKAVATADFAAIGESIWQGIVNGLNAFEFNTAEWIRIHLTDPVKRFLGIASPSSFFFGIGSDIVQGLINGISSLSNTVYLTFKGIIDRLLNLPGFKQIADFLGITTGSGQIGDIGGGTVGGGAGDPGHTRDGLPIDTLAGGVVYNFYGPVYVKTAEDLEMFCPSPHPLMTASSQSLLMSTVSP